MAVEEKSMLKKIGNVLNVLLIIMGIFAWGYLIYTAFHNPKAELEETSQITVYDYSSISEDEMYFKPAHNTSNITSENTEAILYNTLYIQVIDTDFKPIENAEIKLGNADGDLIDTYKTNKYGEVGLTKLKRNTKYKIQQSTTKEGLVIDNTVYTCTIDEPYQNTHTLYLINADKELTSEEKSNYRYDYEDVLKDKSASYEDKLEYLFLKSELRYKDLYVLFYNNLNSIENTKRGLRVEVRIPSATIKYVEIEKVQDDNNVVEILDKDGNPKTKFDGSEFYMTIDRAKSVTNVEYKMKVRFDYDGKHYIIGKTLDIDDLRYNPRGKIAVDLYNKDNDERLPADTPIYLAEVNPETGEVVDEVHSTTIGETGKVLRNVSVGTYKFYIIRNDQKIYSDPFEVTNKKTVTVAMSVASNNEVTTKLGLGKSLKIKSINDEGKAVPGVKYSLYEKEDNYLVIDVITDKDGIAEVNNLDTDIEYYIKQSDSENAESFTFLPLENSAVTKNLVVK